MPSASNPDQQLLRVDAILMKTSLALRSTWEIRVRRVKAIQY